MTHLVQLKTAGIECTHFGHDTRRREWSHPTMTNPHHFVRTLFAVLVTTLIAAPVLAGKPVVGKEFPTFTGKDPISGKKLDLKDFRGKVVLIDFWATWCPPCVAEIPNVKKVYKKYHDQGFEIISISLDQSKSKGKSYIKKKKMNWHHVVDGGGWKTRLAKKYGINSIPAMFIIDHEGVVISNKARGKALERIVKEALENLPENPPDAGSADSEYSGGAGGIGGNLDAKQLKRLTRRLDAAQRILESAATPFQSLYDKLDQVDDLTLELEENFAPTDFARKWESLHKTIQEIRGSLFAHGVLNLTEAAFPPDPTQKESFDPDRDRAIKHDYLQQINKHQVTLRQATDRAMRQIREYSTAIRQQEALMQQGQEAYSTFLAENKKLQKSAEQLRHQIQYAWQDQIRYADQYLNLLRKSAPTSADQPPRGESFLTRINDCRSMLRAAARNRKTLLKLRDDFDALCRDLQSWANEPRREDAKPSDEPLLLPTNPLARVLKLDSRTRIKVEKQLEQAEKAVAQLQKLTSGVNASLARLRLKLDEMQTKLQTIDDDPSVSHHLEERFQSFCRDFLEEWDRISLGRNE